MPTPIELREDAARIATNARAKLDEITADTNESRAAEIEAEFDAMMVDHDKLIARAERLDRVDAADARAANAPDDRRPGGEGQSRGFEPGAAAPTYGEVFARAIRFGASELSSEERAVLMAQRGEMTPEMRALASGTGSAGGFLVPEDFSNEIDRAIALWGPMWDSDIARELNTASGAALPWPTVDDTGKSGRKKAENASVDDDGTDDAVIGEVILGAHVSDTGMIRVPLELLQDASFDMESLLSDLFGERMGRRANAALTTGTGTGEATGIVVGSAAGKTAAAAAAVTADELIDLQHSVDPAYRGSPKCRWQFNDSTLGAIRKLKDGDGNFLWQMGDVRSGEPDRLLGHAYSVNQAMDAMTTGNKPIIFGDHSRYVVRKVGGFQTLTLRERYAENFQIGMVGFARFDGKLLNSAAVKHLIMA